MRVTFGAAALAAGLVVAAASPASAHEEITPRTVEVGTPTFMTITAANEQKVPLTRLEVQAPKGVSLGLTRAPNGWTAESDARHATFTGRLAPEHFEQFGFEIEGADQPGQAVFTAVLSFAGADTDTVRVPVTVTAAGGAATPVTLKPSESSAPTASSPPVGATSPPSAAPVTARSREQTHDNRALGVALVALLAAVAALAAALLRRSPRSAGAAGTGQDW
ncbi:MAG: hypothetical protein ABI912_12325 [Actinomycetota bacterium]